MIVALIADVGGLLLLLAGGTSGIWSSLAVFWSEGLAASVTAAVRGAQRQSDLPDDRWLAEAHLIIDRLAASPLAVDESRRDREREIERRRARLTELAAIDRRTPEGTIAFRSARATEDRLAAGVSGCVLVAFPVIQGIFLLLLGVVAPVLGAAINGLSGGFPADGLDGGLAQGVLFPGAEAGFGVPTVAQPLLLVASMAAVLAAGLWDLRRRVGLDEAEGQVRAGIVRIFAMQAVLLAGGALSIVIGWAGLAIGLTLGKLLLDVVANRRRATGR